MGVKITSELPRRRPEENAVHDGVRSSAAGKAHLKVTFNIPNQISTARKGGETLCLNHSPRIGVDQVNGLRASGVIPIAHVDRKTVCKTIREPDIDAERPG